MKTSQFLIIVLFCNLQNLVFCKAAQANKPTNPNHNPSQNKRRFLQQVAYYVTALPPPPAQSPVPVQQVPITQQSAYITPAVLNNSPQPISLNNNVNQRGQVTNYQKPIQPVIRLQPKPVIQQTIPNILNQQPQKKLNTGLTNTTNNNITNGSVIKDLQSAIYHLNNAVGSITTKITGGPRRDQMTVPVIANTTPATPAVTQKAIVVTSPKIGPVEYKKVTKGDWITMDAVYAKSKSWDVRLQALKSGTKGDKKKSKDSKDRKTDSSSKAKSSSKSKPATGQATPSATVMPASAQTPASTTTTTNTSTAPQNQYITAGSTSVASKQAAAQASSST